MFIAKLNEITDGRKVFYSDSLNYASLGLALLMNIIHVAFIYFKLGFSNATIIIHYNVVYGQDLVQKEKFVYIIPATALFFFILNVILANYFYRKEKLASYFLNFSNLAVQLIFFVASIIIVKING